MISDFLNNNSLLEKTYKSFINGEISIAQFLETNKGQHYGGQYINQANKEGLIPSEYRERTIRALAVPNAFRGKLMASFLQTASKEERKYAVKLIQNDYYTLAQLIKELVVDGETLIEILQNINIKQEGYEDVKGAIVQFLYKNRHSELCFEVKMKIIELLKKDPEALYFIMESETLIGKELDAMYDMAYKEIFKYAKRNIKRLYLVMYRFKNQITDDDLEVLVDKIIIQTNVAMAKDLLCWDILNENVRKKLEAMLIAVKLMGKKTK